MSGELDQCRRMWRRLGVSKADAREMAAELEADLDAAAAEGHSPTAMVGSDVRAFAKAWAEERGVVRPRLCLATTAVAAVLGAIPGASFGLFVAYGLSSSAMAEILGRQMVRVAPNRYEVAPLAPPTWLLLVLYTLGAVFAYAGAVGAVALALQLRLDPMIRRTVTSMAAALPIATAAAIGSTVAYSSTTGYSTSLRVVVIDLFVAGVVFAAGVALIRYLAVRHEQLVPRSG